MILKWDTEEERLRKFMNISPIKKLEWLYQMNKFMHKFSIRKNVARQRIK